MERTVDTEKKLLYSMGEVAEMFDVNQSLIRFWEKNFDILKPQKNRKGNRQFTPKDIENLKTIYHLVKEKGMTIEGAKKMMKQNPMGIERDAQVVDKLMNIRTTLLEIKSELHEQDPDNESELDEWHDATPTQTVPEAQNTTNDTHIENFSEEVKTINKKIKVAQNTEADIVKETTTIKEGINSEIADAKTEEICSEKINIPSQEKQTEDKKSTIKSEPKPEPKPTQVENIPVESTVTEIISKIEAETLENPEKAKNIWEEIFGHEPTKQSGSYEEPDANHKSADGEVNTTNIDSTIETETDIEIEINTNNNVNNKADDAAASRLVDGRVAGADMVNNADAAKVDRAELGRVSGADMVNNADAAKVDRAELGRVSDGKVDGAASAEAELDMAIDGCDDTKTGDANLDNAVLSDSNLGNTNLGNSDSDNAEDSGDSNSGNAEENSGDSDSGDQTQHVVQQSLF